MSRRSSRSPLFVTTRDVDQRVRELSRLMGYAVTLALQPELEPGGHHRPFGLTRLKE